MSFVMWMTGLPCSGKSTIAKKLHEQIPNMEVLDGDELHKILGMNDFSKESRLAQTSRIAYIAKLLLKHNIPVCVSVVSPFHESRELAKKIIDDNRFFLTHLKCSLETCISRDPKGKYKKTKDITKFTGPFEQPKLVDLTIDTENNPIEKSVSEIIDFLEKKLILKH